LFRVSKDFTGAKIFMDNDKKQPSEKSDSTRRRLLIGLAGTPILASLPSRTAWGSHGGACSISGMLSGNLSNHRHDCPPGGNGKTPGYWKTHPVCWPEISSLMLGFGTVHNGTEEVDPCKVSNTQGALRQPNSYTYTGGTTLDGLISEILTDYGSSLIWAGGFSLQMMEYLHRGSEYPKHACAAFLSALHPSISYPYSALEIAEAMATVNGDMTRESQLADIFVHFNENNDENAFLVQRCH
jgi:hypothetical protein